MGKLDLKQLRLFSWWKQVLGFTEGSPEHVPEQHTTVINLELSVALQEQRPSPWFLSVLCSDPYWKKFLYGQLPVQTARCMVGDEHDTFLLRTGEWGGGDCFGKWWLLRPVPNHSHPPATSGKAAYDLSKMIGTSHVEPDTWKKEAKSCGKHL